MGKTMIKCSLCPQEFDESDPLLESRKERHKQYHIRTENPATENHIYGSVEWLKL